MGDWVEAILITIYINIERLKNAIDYNVLVLLMILL